MAYGSLMGRLLPVGDINAWIWSRGGLGMEGKR